MRTLVIVLALVATPAFAEAPKPRPVTPQEARAAVCKPDGVQKAGGPKAPASRSGKLGDMPQARMELAVERRIGWCTVPVIVRENVELPRR